MSEQQNSTCEDIVHSVMHGSKRPIIAYIALKWRFRFTPEEQQELVDRIVTDTRLAKVALQDVPNLTDTQRAQLEGVC